MIAGSLLLAQPALAQNAHNAGALHGSTISDDQAQITALLKNEFERDDLRLIVEPVIVEDDWAVAGWIQQNRGGRGLLKKTAHGWTVHMCSGAPFKHARNLAQTGMGEATAAAIADKLATAEAALGAERIALMDSFEGTIEIQSGSQHGHHPQSAPK